MSANTEYLVPKYLPDFSCKMGACRSACCVGWPVSVSMKNYFTLLGLPCRKELRERLDCALRLADHPTEEEYARFTPNWLGDCPMRMEDGRCSIHAELGEDALSDVCRLYPRGVRLWGDQYECSASNSCEKTLELLWDLKEPLTFETRALPVVPPPRPGTVQPTEGLSTDESFRFSMIRAMSESSRTIEDRILSVYAMLGLEGEAVRGGGAASLLAYYAARSSSIRETGERICARYEADPGKWTEDVLSFDALFPMWERFAGQVLLNHLFFTQFPYLGVSRREVWLTLAAVYALNRIYTVGGIALLAQDGGEPGKDALIDLTAALFRLIAHTAFEKSVGAAFGNTDVVLPVRI